MNRAPAIEDLTFARVSEFYLRDLRQGAAQPIEDYARAFPHLADEIRESFPMMSLLEEHQEERAEKLEQGKHIGSCLLEHEIGRGAMGTVYAGYQPTLGRRVAVKVMGLQGSNLQAATDRFEKECRAMARLDHANIIPIYEHGCDGSHSYLVMKLVEGRSLDKLIGENPDYRSQALLAELLGDWNRFAEIAARIASALQHAHERGIVHRDIKPANLLLDSSGDPWISDFGIAKLHEQDCNATRSGCLMGTPRYMAPEQFRGFSDTRSDIYALGLTLRVLIVGRHSIDPSAHADGSSSETKNLPSLRTINPDVPEGIDQIISKACALDPDARYQSAAELQLVLSRFANHQMPADRRRERRPSDEAYRRRKRSIGMVIGALAIIAPCSIVLMERYQAAPEVANVKDQRRSKASVFLEQISSPDSRSSKSVVEALVKDISLPITGGSLGSPSRARKSFAQQRDASTRPTTPADQSDSIRRKAYAESLQSVESTIDSGQLDELRVSDLVNAYRSTSLPAATRLMNRFGVIKRSGLSDAEKQAAMQIMGLYSTAIVNRHIPEGEANIAIDVLTGGTPVSAEEIDRIKIPDRTIRSWLGMLQSRVRTLPLQIESEKPRIEDELRGIFEKALQSHRDE